MGGFAESARVGVYPDHENAGLVAGGQNDCRAVTRPQVDDRPLVEASDQLVELADVELSELTSHYRAHRAMIAYR